MNGPELLKASGPSPTAGKPLTVVIEHDGDFAYRVMVDGSPIPRPGEPRHADSCDASLRVALAALARRQIEDTLNIRAITGNARAIIGKAVHSAVTYAMNHGFEAAIAAHDSMYGDLEGCSFHSNPADKASNWPACPLCEDRGFADSECPNCGLGIARSAG